MKGRFHDRTPCVETAFLVFVRFFAVLKIFYFNAL